MQNIRYILCDIEGTTSSIAFVHEVLFPYSEKHMDDFLKQHASDPAVQKILSQVWETAATEKKELNTQTVASASATLKQWIKEDRKHPALKALQGMIWKRGFENSDFQGHVYEDAAKAMISWKKQGLTLGIYSSGSVEAQKLYFKYSDHGDLSALFSNHFDTGVGAKRESVAYKNILNILQRPAVEVLFLSDIAEELDAAKSCGIETIQIVRDSGITKSGHHKTVKDFSSIHLIGNNNPT